MPSFAMLNPSLKTSGDGDSFTDGDFSGEGDGEATGAARGDWDNIWGN